MASKDVQLYDLDGDGDLDAFVPESRGGLCQPDHVYLNHMRDFKRADSNDDILVNIGDPIFTLSWLFTDGSTPHCLDAADANDDGRTDISDPVHTLSFLFLGGPAPPPPFGACDVDPTQDALGCLGYNSCVRMEVRGDLTNAGSSDHDGMGNWELLMSHNTACYPFDPVVNSSFPDCTSTPNNLCTGFETSYASVVADVGSPGGGGKDNKPDIITVGGGDFMRVLINTSRRRAWGRERACPVEPSSGHEAVIHVTGGAERGDKNDVRRGRLALGIIGSGGRGKWIADLFEKHSQTKVVAVADYFRDRAAAAGERFQVEPSRRHAGLAAYRRLLDEKLDAVAIESPPFFHPEQAAAAVDAGRHVFLAKPIAVDVPGCQTVAESGKKATAKKLCFLVDFQTRASEHYQEAVRRVRRGDIGKVALGQAYYQTGGTWGDAATYASSEDRLRRWGSDAALSGDIIVEQNIHALDVATWFLDADPIRAVGTGGRKVRSGAGDCWDHFAVVFTFPDQVVIDFSSTQYTKGYDDICCRLYGARGTVDTHYFGSVSIQGEAPYPGGDHPNLYTDGAVANIKTFCTSIASGDCANPTVAPSVRSNLTCILGRIAAHERRAVTWDEMMTACARVDGKLEGLVT
jgi:predicted dehydrogenase